jgi:very-short-patch-repair endonuclease
MGGRRAAGTEEERRRRRVERERSVSRLATQQHGVVSRSQLLGAGLTARMIERRLESGYLHPLHRGVYAVGHERLGSRSHWMAAVLAGGDGAVLSHRSAAALWGLRRRRRGPIEVSATSSRLTRAVGLGEIRFREGRVRPGERELVTGIPVTSIARTLLDQADVVDGRELAGEFEEADRLGLLEMREIEAVCAQNPGRRGLKPLRHLIAEARYPEPARTPLEDGLLRLCREHGLPAPRTNVEVLGREVDAFWPRQRLMVEADSWSFHRHRAAFERDRARDAAMQAEGYRVIRLTHRRMEREPEAVASELRRLLGLATPAENDRGQGTVEWIGLVAVVALAIVGLAAAGARVPGASLAGAVGAKILCAAALADRCGDEPVLIAAYGTEVGELARERMPALAFEEGARALPVDFRRCRSSACGDGSARGLVDRTDAGLPVTAFVHVVDCRDGDGPGCSGDRAGNLYLQYWLYYADSATLRGVPVAGAAGYHRDDWESVQVRIGPDGAVRERASSHHGYNHARDVANVGSDAGIGPLRTIAEAVGARPRNGWGAAEGLLRVSGGSHAGNAGGYLNLDRIVLGGRVHLVPLEPLAATSEGYEFAVVPPWGKRVWRDPEAAGTD